MKITWAGKIKKALSEGVKAPIPLEGDVMKNIVGAHSLTTGKSAVGGESVGGGFIVVPMSGSDKQTIIDELRKEGVEFSEVAHEHQSALQIHLERDSLQAAALLQDLAKKGVNFDEESGVWGTSGKFGRMEGASGKYIVVRKSDGKLVDGPFDSEEAAGDAWNDYPPEERGKYKVLPYQDEMTEQSPMFGIDMTEQGEEWSWDEVEEALTQYGLDVGAVYGTMKQMLKPVSLDVAQDFRAGEIRDAVKYAGYDDSEARDVVRKLRQMRQGVLTGVSEATEDDVREALAPVLDRSNRRIVNLGPSEAGGFTALLDNGVSLEVSPAGASGALGDWVIVVNGEAFDPMSPRGVEDLVREIESPPVGEGTERSYQVGDPVEVSVSGLRRMTILTDEPVRGEVVRVSPTSLGTNYRVHLEHSLKTRTGRVVNAVALRGEDLSSSSFDEDTYTSDVAITDVIPITKGGEKVVKLPGLTRAGRRRTKRRYQKVGESMSRGQSVVSLVLRPGEVGELDDKPVWSALHESGVIEVKPFKMGAEEFMEVKIDTRRKEWADANVTALLDEVGSINPTLQSKIQERADPKDVAADIENWVQTGIFEYAEAEMASPSQKVREMILAAKLRGTMPTKEWLAEQLFADPSAIHELIMLREPSNAVMEELRLSPTDVVAKAAKLHFKEAEVKRGPGLRVHSDLRDLVVQAGDYIRKIRTTPEGGWEVLLQSGGRFDIAYESVHPKGGGWTVMSTDGRTRFDFPEESSEIVDWLRREREGVTERSLTEMTDAEQDEEAEEMLKRYNAEPTSLWLYTSLPITERMAWAYLTADEFKGAPYEGDEVRRFVSALKEVVASPETFWEQVSAKDSARAEYLREMDWSVEKVPLEEVGVYPNFGGFPREWSRGNLLTTAEKLAVGTERPEKRHSVLEMTDQWMTILKFLPPILVEGGTLRGREPEEYEATKWDVDDGNHRLVAAAIGGAREAVCFVGRRKAEESPQDVQATAAKGEIGEQETTDPAANLSAMGAPSGSTIMSTMEQDPEGITSSSTWQPGSMFKLHVLGSQSGEGEWVYREVVGHEGEGEKSNLIYKTPEGRVMRLPHGQVDAALGFGGATGPEELGVKTGETPGEEEPVPPMGEPTMGEQAPMGQPQETPETRGLERDPGFSRAIAKYHRTKDEADWQEVRKEAQRVLGVAGPDVDKVVGQYVVKEASAEEWTWMSVISVRGEEDWKGGYVRASTPEEAAVAAVTAWGWASAEDVGPEPAVKLKPVRARTQAYKDVYRVESVGDFTIWPDEMELLIVRGHRKTSDLGPILKMPRYVDVKGDIEIEEPWGLRTEEPGRRTEEDVIVKPVKEKDFKGKKKTVAVERFTQDAEFNSLLNKLELTKNEGYRVRAISRAARVAGIPVKEARELVEKLLGAVKETTKG